MPGAPVGVPDVPDGVSGGVLCVPIDMPGAPVGVPGAPVRVPGATYVRHRTCQGFGQK